MWLSTGNLSPYANTLPENGTEAFMLDTTNMQIYNCDHPHHIALFNMLDGKPKSEWDFSVVMRRILFSLLAFPLMKLLGYETGGVLFSILLNLLAYFIFIRFIKNKYGYKSSLISAWLLSLYPGIMYGVGTPYAYNCIVPFTIFSTILLFKIQDTVKIKWFFLYFFLMGVLFTGYDLISFFLPAALIILFIKRKYIIIPLAIILMVLPSVILNLILSYFLEIEFKNDSSNIYSVIINSYFQIFNNITDWNWIYEWLRYVLYQNNFLIILGHIFLKSNFYVLPSLFILFYLIGHFKYHMRLNLIEGTLLFVTLLIFLFNHLAPKYTGYQMRGDWIARIYQPVFIVYTYHVFLILLLRI